MKFRSYVIITLQVACRTKRQAGAGSMPARCPPQGHGDAEVDRSYCERKKLMAPGKLQWALGRLQTLNKCDQFGNDDVMRILLNKMPRVFDSRDMCVRK